MKQDNIQLPPPLQMHAEPPGGEDELDLGQLLSILWAGRWIIVLSTAITCLLGLTYLIAARPIYEANGLVQVEQDGKSMTSGMGDLAMLFGAPMETEAEIQILKSRMVLNKVIDNLNLLVSTEPKYFPIFGAFVARKRGEGEVLESPLFLRGYAWSGEKLTVGTFEVPDQWLSEPFELISGSDGNYELTAPGGIAVLKGQVGSAAIADINGRRVEIFVRELVAHPGTRFSVTKHARADVLQTLGEELRVAEQGKQSGVISLKIASHSKAEAADIIQQIQDAYVRQNVERRSAEAAQSLEFLQEQLPEIKGRVDAAQAKLNTYQLRQGSIDVTKETELVLEQSVDLETKRLELIGQRQQAIQRFTPQHPVVQALDAQIRALESEQNSIRKRTETLPETQQEVLSLVRDLEVNRQIYTALLNSAQELQVAKAGTVGNVRILDYPMVPYKKSRPNSILVAALSVLFGGALGVGFIFLRNALFRGVDNPDEVERVLGLPTYAAIPFTASQRRLANILQRKEAGRKLLAEVEPDNVAVEALRSLRTSLQFALLEASNNVILFTGPTAGLGKSFVSMNLAAVLAQSGKRVVVVDGDLRRGYLHKYFGESAKPGISDYVAGKVDLQSIVRDTPVANLKLVTNGTVPPNPSELLLHERFIQLMETLSGMADFVIIDTPPVLPVTDASVIGRLAGCVLLVLKEGAHPMRSVEETVRRLRQGGVQVKGTVFNQVGHRGGGYYGYYSSYGYAYSSKYGSRSG
jgi:tyrosine-protein kinase Etk/Wzc